MIGMRTIKRSSTRVLILFLILLTLLCSMASAAEIRSTFTSENRDDQGETTFYTYLKQSDLKESSYTRGLETGSLNYFKGRGTIEDTQTYYDGKVDSEHSRVSEDHNSTVTHKLSVKYNGVKGLSLFYAKGFYTDNRAVAASKKIWFVNETYFPSNIATVTGDVSMSMKGNYHMDYKAQAQNAYFVFNDVSGLSNKTGSRRIDFEQEGLIKGDINVVNKLDVEDAYIARAPSKEEWLPCFCFTGTFPAIEPTEGEDSAWPGMNILKVLNSDDGKVRGSARETTTTQGPILELPDMQVESFYEKTSTTGYYAISELTIRVRNTGLKELENVRLVGQIPPEVVYLPSSGRVDMSPSEPNYVARDLMWTLGNLKPVSGPDGLKTVVMKVNSTVDISNTVKFYAIYKIGNTENSTVPVAPRNMVSVEEF